MSWSAAGYRRILWPSPHGRSEFLPKMAVPGAVAGGKAMNVSHPKGRPSGNKLLLCQEEQRGDNNLASQEEEEEEEAAVDVVVGFIVSSCPEEEGEEQGES